MNKRILLSSISIFASAALVAGATFAFFSDTETSSDNTLQAGAIDLQIDNTSYLNGVFNQGTSWLQKDLESGDFFFDFLDLKPGDYGEDTISVHVDNNPSWVCADVTLTSDDDESSTEPELEDGDDPDTGDINDGELADAVEFIWWADDGDNVLEVGEQLLPAGPIGLLGVGGSATVALADSNTNIWETPGPSPSPLPGATTRYVGKAWCFGEITTNPIAQDGPVVDTTPADDIPDNGPDTRGAGFTCDGTGEDDRTQTDSMTADISFRATQARNNDGFTCEPVVTP